MKNKSPRQSVSDSGEVDASEGQDEGGDEGESEGASDYGGEG